MKLEEAQTIFSDYEEVLNQEGALGGRRSPSLLPTSKVEILHAIQLLVAQLYYQGLDDEQDLAPLIRGAMFLDSFTHDAVDGMSFVESMEARRSEIVAFHRGLLRIPRNDRYFWQRVYALAGMSVETKSSTFFETLKERLGKALLREA